MITWIDGFAGWDGGLPAVLIAEKIPIERRRALLQAMVVKSLGVNADAIAIDHVQGRPPLVAKPIGSGLYLSLASRGPSTAAGIAASPIGVDVELRDGGRDVPWNVLHDGEAAFLATLGGEDRAWAFARLWSLKEAYLKALGIGLSREPSSFEISFTDEHSATFLDPGASARVAEAGTIWRAAGGTWAALSAVILEPQPP